MKKRSIGVVVAAAVVAVAVVPVLAFGAAGWSVNGPARGSGWSCEEVPQVVELGKTQAQLGKLELSQRIDDAAGQAGERASGQTEEPQTAAPVAACPGFEDADGDGICDHWEEGACPSEHWCGNGQGDYGCGSGYADADNDGVCDRWEEGACLGGGHGYGSGASVGNGRGAGHGHGHGGNHGRCW